MIEIRFEAENSRSAAYDGDRLVGKADFTEKDAVWTITHTETDPACRGQGIARRLVEKIVEEAGKSHKKIDPQCSYAAGLFERTPAWHDLTARKDDQ
jgi:predicted GNAT family acetyltransferase